MSGSRITEHQSNNGAWVYALLIPCLILIFFSHPFLKLPYDPWEHLIKIRSIFDTGECFLYWPENRSTFCSWHRTWAAIFTYLNIDDTLAWATIIHRTQFFFALLCLFYFSRTVIALCVKELSRNQIVLMAFFATLFWLVGNGTYSVEYQQAWIMWYSITYQGATIPLYWLITAFSLLLCFEPSTSLAKKFTLSILILSGFLIILAYHPSEAVYFLLFFFLVLLLTPVIPFKRKLIFGCLIFTVGTIFLYFSSLYIHIPLLRSIIRGADIFDVLQQISLTGEKITDHGLNRLTNSYSELAIFASTIALIYWFALVLFARQKLNATITVLVFATCLFFVIPTSKWLSGLVGMVLHKDIVWRFFFASPWFVMLPLIMINTTKKSNNTVFYSCSFLALILVTTTFISHQYLNGALYGNVVSLARSFDNKKAGVQYSEQTISNLKNIIQQRTDEQEKEEIILYLRGDMATIARALFGYYVYTHRRVIIPMHGFYYAGLDKKYEMVPIHLPRDFPKDSRIFNHFNLDERRISQKINREFKQGVPLRFNLESKDLSKFTFWIKGWAFLEGKLGESDVHVILQSDEHTYIFDTSNKYRGDVARYFKSKELENTGFLATIRREDIYPGEYKIGLIVEQDDAESADFTDQTIEIARYSER